MNAEFPNDLWHAPSGAFSPVLIIGVEYGGALGLEPLQKSYTGGL